MKAEDLVRLYDAGGSRLIVDRKLAAQYGYNNGDEVAASVFETLRDRQKEINEQRFARKVHRPASPTSRLVGSVLHRSAVAVLQSSGDQTFRGEDDLQSPSGPEAGRDDVQGVEHLAPVQALSRGGEAGDSHIPGEFSERAVGRNGHSGGAPTARPEAEPYTLTCVFFFTEE